jgi:poly(hydroxyalkanoate) granule-associated protein
MAEKIEVMEEKVQEEKRALLDGARRVLMAGIGAVALAQEEAEDFVNRLVERGEIAEKDGRKLINDVVEKRREQARERAQKAEQKLDKRLEKMLQRMNVPTKEDIDTLSAKIATLTKKVDELKKQQSS